MERKKEEFSHCHAQETMQSISQQLKAEAIDFFAESFSNIRFLFFTVILPLISSHAR
jgi:hypothetical protein